MRDQDDRVHRAWDIFIGLCATATALMIPVGLVFRLAGETFVTYINWFITVVYVVDIGVRYHPAAGPGALRARAA